jgi:hypothetical protein
MGNVLSANSDGVGRSEGRGLGLLDADGRGDGVNVARALGERDATGALDDVHPATSRVSKTPQTAVFTLALCCYQRELVQLSSAGLAIGAVQELNSPRG